MLLHSSPPWVRGALTAGLALWLASSAGPRARAEDDPGLPNPGLESVDAAGQPLHWTKTGGGRMEVSSVAHQGARAVSVTDAPDGNFSGWTTELPVRPDRSYRFAGFGKASEVLNAHGLVPGGVLQLQFVDQDGRPLGQPAFSGTVGAGADWKRIATPAAVPPPGAARVQLLAGMQYCNGTVFFDDFSLETAPVAAAATAALRRDHPQPDPRVHYAANLLTNGNVEDGAGDAPAGWTFVGRAAADWTPAEIEALHANGRPAFSVGRARGVWSGEAYEGHRALELIPTDPPLSHRSQWYGCNPVDGYWLSAPAPCQPGKSYLAGAWIKFGRRVSEPWYGPLELKFYDAAGAEINTASANVRSPVANAAAGEWLWWTTVPWPAPENAVSMRLRFGQEFSADRGSFGTMLADNFAVWPLPDGAPPADPRRVHLNYAGYLDWFEQATAQVKPPYLPSPAEAAAYTTAAVVFPNVRPGNIFEDPQASVPLRAEVRNLLGEARRVRLRVTPFDVWGHQQAPFETLPVDLPGYSVASVEVPLPPPCSFGCFYLETKVLEGDVEAASGSGRFAVIPPRTRTHTAPPLWAVTTLLDLSGDDTPYEQELGFLLRRAGFDYAWERLGYSRLHPEALPGEIARMQKKIDWFHRYGMQTILNLNVDNDLSPVASDYRELGRQIGAAFRGRVAALSNWGIEKANSGSPYRGSGTGRATDTDYDTVMAAQYDGVKSAAPDLPVLTGNIATDMEAKTVNRLYAAPVEGRFDGMVINAYMGAPVVVRNNLAAFDAHGDKQKAIWPEESANQRSPSQGPERRYAEVEGPRNMINTWLDLFRQGRGRVRSLTMWGFVDQSAASDIPMMTPGLQPRPQYAACAVLTDQLADARLRADRSTEGYTTLEWQRGPRTLFTSWANDGESNLTLRVPDGSVTVTDLFGNVSPVAVNHGLATVKLSEYPVYVDCPAGSDVDQRLRARLTQAAAFSADAPACALRLENLDAQPLAGTVVFAEGRPAGVAQSFSLAPGASARLESLVNPDGLRPGARAPFHADIELKDGTRTRVTAALNFAAAVRAARPPALDGTWMGWEAARVIPFDEPRLMEGGQTPDEPYRGKEDISGQIRLLWDDQFLYLGVQAFDDKHVAQTNREDMRGFLADSIEFGIQPEDRLTTTAPYWEYELYLPDDGNDQCVLNRRLPAPTGRETRWPAAVKLTGQRGDCIYQVAVPWKDLGVTAPRAGENIALSVNLNDVDEPTHRRTGSRKLIHWFSGIEGAKNPARFGDVTLVDQPSPAKSSD